MNLNPFYKAELNGNIMYYNFDNTDEAHKFYINDDLIGEFKKVLGKHTFSHEEVEFTIESKLTSATRKLVVGGREIQMDKVSKKKMRKLLSEKNIFNEVNPTQEEIEDAKFKFSDLMLPLILIVLAIGIQYFTHDKDIYYKIIPGIPSFIAGLMLKNILIRHVRFLEPIRKLGIGIVILVIIVVEMISNQIY